jgi:hypothetical protein
MLIEWSGDPHFGGEKSPAKFPARSFDFERQHYDTEPLRCKKPEAISCTSTAAWSDQRCLADEVIE